MRLFRKIIIILLTVIIALTGTLGFGDSSVEAKSKTVLYNSSIKTSKTETYFSKEYINSHGYYTKCQIKGDKLIIKGSLNS